MLIADTKSERLFCFLLQHIGDWGKKEKLDPKALSKTGLSFMARLSLGVWKNYAPKFAFCLFCFFPSSEDDNLYMGSFFLGPVLHTTCMQVPIYGRSIVVVALVF